MTLRFAHLSPSYKRKAVESLRLADGHSLVTNDVPESSADSPGDSVAIDAEVVKLVDALRSGRSSLIESGGSSPPFGIYSFLTG